MKKILFLVATVLLSTLATFAQPTQFEVDGNVVGIEFFDSEIVHVTKYPKGSTSNNKSLVVVMKPQKLNVKQNNYTLTCGSIAVKLDPKTGAITFLNNGKVLLREKTCNFEPCNREAEKGKFRVSQTFTLDKDEAIYGLGTIQNGKMNRRGEHKLMEQSNLEDFQNVLQSIKGYGIFWDNYSPTQFDDDNSGMKFSSAVGSRIDYYFMYGGSADGVVGKMRTLTGSVPMFPLWTFGYWQSKERYKSSRELLSVVDKYRELNVPLDGIIQDWQYWGSNYLWNAMDFLSEDFVDGERMVKLSHEKNAHLMISIWASFGPMTKAFKQLNDKGLLFDFGTWPQSGISHVWPPMMDYPSGVKVYDAFSAEARQIYWQNLKTLHNYGIDAWWMDSTDPDCFYPSETDYDHKAGDDGTWRSLRNAFPLETVRGVYEAQRKEDSQKRVFIMTRSAFAGQQHYGSNMWSGDVASSWDMLRKQIPAGLSFSLTGNPNFNTDIGGFFCNSYNVYGPGSAPKNPQFQELYVRWMQYGLFCPVFRSHGADAPREIWQFGKKGEPVYDAIEQMIRLRYRLIPYLYSISWQASTGNASYLRALFSDFAADKNVWDMTDEFMFGNSILAAPVVEAQFTQEQIIKEDAMTGWDRKDVKNGSTQSVDWSVKKTAEKYLPKGAVWFDFWSGKRYNGGVSVTVETPLNRVPMFVRGGSIIPLAPEMQYVGEKSWQQLDVFVYPGSDGKFTLYEDEGDNYNYEKGAFSIIDFSWNDKTKTLTISDRKGSFSGMLTKRNFNITLIGGGTKNIEYDGKKVEVKL